MGFSFKIIPDDNLVINRITDPFDLKEYYSLMEQIMSDQCFMKSMNMLWDFRDSTLSDFSNQDIQDIRRYVEANRGRRGSGYRVVFLVSKEIDYGLSRMYQMVSEDLPVTFMVFYDEKEAFDWIGGKDDDDG